MNAPTNSLRCLDSVYHGALRFATGCGALTHHCTLYARVEWPSLCTYQGHVVGLVVTVAKSRHVEGAVTKC